MSWYSPIGFPNCLRSLTYVAVRLERRLRQAAGAPAGLEAPCGEALHLEIEALALARRLADQVLRRHEVALEAERERMHAAVARACDRPCRAARRHPAASSRTRGRGRHPSARRTATGPWRPSDMSGSVRASSASTLARPAKVHHALAPLMNQPCLPLELAALGAAAHRGHVRAGVGLGDRDADHQLARGDRRQPLLLLLFRAALQQRLGEDLGPRDEAARGGQRAPSTAPR